MPSPDPIPLLLENLRAYLPRLAGYAGVALVSIPLTFALTWLLHEKAGWTPEAATALALATVFLVTFTLIRHGIYRRREVRGSLSRQIRLALLVSSSFRFAEWAAFALLHRFLPLHYLLLLAFIMGTSFLFKTFLFDRWIFRESAPPPPG